MRYRTMGGLGWKVSEVGYGMWGIGGGPGNFTGWDYDLAPRCLDEAVELGCNFFDTAWVYGRGISERMLGALLKRHPDRRLYVATKIPPKNREWPPGPGDTLDDAYPAGHMREYTYRSLENLGVSRIDLLQFHTWEDRWAGDERWQEVVGDLKREGVIDAVGISVNRWEPANCLAALDTGLIDVIQVIYNIFDQAPEDVLFERARRDGIGIIARVPFDEGTLTGTLTADSTWPEEDWRATYFCDENLKPSVERAERLKEILPDGMSLPELALRFILHHPAVSTVIPGMRKPAHVRANLAVGDGRPLDDALLRELRKHRWDRVPAWWSM
ncbi:aldo/keto reductase [Actinoallomurus soli]|uniref:aldo/keto reductase n=1 Tax=Actinoallomurus soli TaxID=2952535 RepID=UPI00209393DA|nr:aldo/keto reductase [Actinoallomurus soli]MCO5967764.1 aldo/keto reductase [Actinoallomurus soli]